jgi:hypothetical protein
MKGKTLLTAKISIIVGIFIVVLGVVSKDNFVAFIGSSMMILSAWVISLKD